MASYTKEKAGLPEYDGSSNTADRNNGKDPLPDYTTVASSSSGAFQTRFASMSMHMEDRLRFLQFPPEIITICRQTIQATWKRGIQAERDYAGSKEFKVYGTPWSGGRDGEQAIAARRLICAMLGALHGEGWVLTLATDISKKNADKDTLLFRHQVPAPAPCEWCCIAFSREDRLKFIDVPLEISNGVIAKFGTNRVQSHFLLTNNVYEVKLRGTPWRAEGTETMAVRRLLLIMLEVLEEHGWTVYASTDQKNGGEKHTETDTWHCCKPKGWTRGTPVYHN